MILDEPQSLTISCRGTSGPSLEIPQSYNLGHLQQAAIKSLSERPTFTNCKSSRIWAVKILIFFRIFKSNLPHMIWKLYSFADFINQYQFSPIVRTNMQPYQYEILKLYKYLMRNPQNFLGGLGGPNNKADYMNKPKWMEYFYILLKREQNMFTSCKKKYVPWRYWVKWRWAHQSPTVPTSTGDSSCFTILGDHYTRRTRVHKNTSLHCLS